MPYGVQRKKKSKTKRVRLRPRGIYFAFVSLDFEHVSCNCKNQKAIVCERILV